MKELLSKAKESAINSNVKTDLNKFISDYASREERHYCAYLLSWFLSDRTAVKAFFDNHTPLNNESFPELNEADYKDVKVYYEYTAIRELIDFIGRSVRNTTNSNFKQELKSKIELEIFQVTTGDIQKKKPDLVFYFPSSKSLVLVEAKFEMRFDESQIEESRRYGNVLSKLFPEDIANVYVTTLGMDYYLNAINNRYFSISWEKLFTLLPNGNIKNEIKKGLDYQKKIHPKAMSNWS